MTEAEMEEMEKRERYQKYRDRAKERRNKYGDTETAPPLRIRGLAKATKAEQRKRAAEEMEPGPSNDDNDVAPGLGSGNVGAKLMKAMGWSEGKGLGRADQGRVNPVEASGHSGTAGLGASVEGAPDILPTDTYASKVRKTMRQKFINMQR
ncbi:hypothetical protein RvY_05216 [Ramazzottius varieornatus]|uniref:G-patch domain-containing protein n=1 Tax=Ramazzottius varieornatus TaxID=947166 RepID=A0A1D1UXC8_RAMVA|nr:hypothetical protein RvY_05216 [Ramazzottius varieornatus]